MATQNFKLAVNNAKFPFLFQDAGRGILQPGLDTTTRLFGPFAGTADSYDYNIPQLLFAENVLPVGAGLMSVDTREEVEAFATPTTAFDQLITLRDAEERNFLFCPARGANYVYETSTPGWTSYDSFTWSSVRTLVSKAYVDGRTFICYEGDRLIEWDPTLQVFNTITLTLPAGYAITDIRGCCGASNYLILHTTTEVLWSSALSVTNFNDPIGKSGKQTPIDLKGQITAIIPISGGFIIYTTRNAVAAFFTNNPDTPFSFREIQGSGGVATYEQVTSDANQAQHYTYGSSGLQLVNLQRAEPVFPDCADFLASRRYESWDSTTKSIVERTLTGSLRVKLHYFDNRYLFISYGYIDGQFTYCLVYDGGLQRWGKIRINHIDVGVLPSDLLDTFELTYEDLSGAYEDYDIQYDELLQSYGDTLPIRASIVFLQNTGALRVLVSDPSQDSTGGLALFGHVQVTRDRRVTFLGCQIDGLYGYPEPTATLLGSTPGNGYDRDKIRSTTLVNSTERMCAFQGYETFENFDIAFEGKFVITSALVETMIHGAR